MDLIDCVFGFTILMLNNADFKENMAFIYFGAGIVRVGMKKWEEGSYGYMLF